MSRPPAGLARIGGPKLETIAGLVVPARRPTDVNGIHCGAITTVRSKRQVVGEFDDANRVGNEVVLAIVAVVTMCAGLVPFPAVMVKDI